MDGEVEPGHRRRTVDKDIIVEGGIAAETCTNTPGSGSTLPFCLNVD